MQKIIQVIFAFLWFMFSIMITVFLQRGNWFTIIHDLFTDSVAKAFYWFALTLFIIIIDLVIPIFLMINAFKNEDELLQK